MHKIYNSIALAYKSRNLLIGYDAVVDNIRRHRVKIVFVNANSSIRTIKEIQNKCNNYNVDMVILNDYENNFDKIFSNKKIKVIGIKDNNFSKLMRKDIKERNDKS